MTTRERFQVVCAFINEKLHRPPVAELQNNPYFRAQLMTPSEVASAIRDGQMTVELAGDLYDATYVRDGSYNEHNADSIQGLTYSFLKQHGVRTHLDAEDEWLK